MAKRKIYDIIPPQKKKIVSSFSAHSSSATSISTSTSTSSSTTSSPSSQDNLSKSLKQGIKKDIGTKKIVALSVLVIFVLLGVWFFSSAKTVIVEIKPKTHTSVLNTTLSFSTSTQDLDLSKIGSSEVVMPAQAVRMEKDFRKEFSSSLISAEEKAKGVIRVYNKHDRLVSLVKGTRFLSSTKPAKLFRSLKKISIPAKGYVDVPVEASESGDSYNIEPCAFSIPGLRNYSPPRLYFDVYGKSLSKMKGGRVEKIHKITEQNLQQAKTGIVKLATEESEQVLQEKIGPDFIVLKKSIVLTPLEGGLVNSSLGQEVDSFVYQLKVQIYALKIKQSLLSEFAKRYIRLNIPSPMKAVENKIEVKFASEDSKQLTSDVEIKAVIYQDIDQHSLKEIIKGRLLREIPRYVLEVAPYLDGAPKITFRPFWARRATSDIDKIKIKMDF